MIEYLILIPMIIIHELGHYLGFKIFNFNPVIKFTWWGISIGENCFHKLKPLHGFIVAYMGIVFGLLPLLFFNGIQNVIIVYMFMCIIDFVTIIGIMNIEKKHINLTLWEINLIELKEQKNKYGIIKTKNRQ